MIGDSASGLSRASALPPPPSYAAISAIGPRGRMPALANGRYARTSSIGVTSKAPSAIAGTAASGLSMPTERAASITAGNPTACATRTVALLSERSSARRTVTWPS